MGFGWVLVCFCGGFGLVAVLVYNVISQLVVALQGRSVSVSRLRVRRRCLACVFPFVTCGYFPLNEKRANHPIAKKKTVSMSMFAI